MDKRCRFCGVEYMVIRYDNARGMCSTCQDYWTREYAKVGIQCLRAKRHGLPATLTIYEWMNTLVRFRWTCGYCQSSPYEAIDHFIPVAKGGGTTQLNCVPACARCNRMKHDISPDLLGSSFSREALDRIRTLLKRAW